MFKRLLLGALGIAFLLGTFAPSAHADPPKPYFYIVAADPQLLWGQKDARNWEEAVRHINRLEPDFVIVCGDQIQGANESKAWAEPEKIKAYDRLAKLYLDAAKKIKPEIKLYNVAGNHDVSLKPTAKTLAWYEGHFGKPWYSFEHKQSLFVVLESNLLRESGGAPDLAIKQTGWLRETLAKAGGKSYLHKTAYMHHPMCLKSVDEKGAYFNMPLRLRTEMLRMFHAREFRAVFSGHFHKNAYVKDGELELITTSSCGKALGKDPLGFRIVKVYPDRLEHKYYGFDKLPEKIEFK
jgi:3',5'-cyclic AMP phosphodiesterase CpdA